MATPIADAARGRRDGVLRRPRGLRRRRRHAASRWVGGRCRHRDQRGPRRDHAAHVRHGWRPVRARPPPGRPAGRALCRRSRRHAAATPSPCARKGTGPCPSEATSAAHPCPGASTAGARSTSVTAACRSPRCSNRRGVRQRRGSRRRRCSPWRPRSSPTSPAPMTSCRTAAWRQARGSVGRRSGRPCAPSDTAAARRSTRAPSAMPSSRSATVCTSAPTSRGPRRTGSRRSRSRRGAIASGPSRRRRRATWR